MSIEVVEAAPDNMLTTVTVAKASLGISDTNSDELIESMIRAASDFAERYCGRQFARQKIREGLPGKGVPDLLLSLTPIVTIESVMFDDATVPESSWSLADKDAGIIQSNLGNFHGTYFGDLNAIDRFPSSFTQERYFITYTGGYVLPNWPSDPYGNRTLPYDLERAILETTKKLFKDDKSGLSWDGVMASYKIGDTSVSWGNKSTAQNQALDGNVSAFFPPSALAVLNYYRRAY